MRCGVASLSRKKATVRYSFGRIHATAAYEDFRERPFEALKKARLYELNIRWTSGNYTGLIPSEEAADHIINLLRDSYPAAYVEDGVKPLSGVHGMVDYERYLVLRVTEKQRRSVRQLIAREVNRPAEEIANWVEDVGEAKLAVL